MNGVCSQPSETVPRKRVLLVSEPPILREALACLLEREPDLQIVGRIDRLDDVERAVCGHQPELILLDMSQGGIQSLEQIRQLRAAYPMVRVLVLSGSREAFLAERVLRAGAHGYVLAHEPPEALVHAIHRCLRGEIYLVRELADELLCRISGNGATLAGQSGAPAGIARLSDRELEVLHLLGKGLRVREIAEKLYRSVKTIEAHREHIKRKLNLKSSAALMRYAFDVTRNG